MKKLLSLSLMLSLGLATVTPALNAAQSQTVAQSQANPADASGWQAAKKWWRSGRNMKALNPQEKKAFESLMKKFTIRTIILGILAIIGGIAYKEYRSEQEKKAQRYAARQEHTEQLRLYREEMQKNFSVELETLVQRLLTKNFSSVRLKGDQQHPLSSQDGTLYESINPEKLKITALKSDQKLDTFIDGFNQADPEIKKIIIKEAKEFVTSRIRARPEERKKSLIILLEEIYAGLKHPVGPRTKRIGI